MKLLRELVENVEVLTEQTQNGKIYFLEGKLIQCEKPNKNNRVYPKDMMNEKVAEYIKEFVQHRGAYGELGHPETPTINPDKISHLITELREDGDDYVGKIEILPTPNGKIIETFIERRTRIGSSTRGVGSVSTNEGVSHVQDDFKIMTASDIVTDPSAYGAYLDAIMEGVEWAYDAMSRNWRQIETIQKNIKKAPANRLQEERLRNIKKYLIKL